MKGANMPAFQNLILTDRAATPVAKTFAPIERNTQTGVVTVAHSDDGSVLARKKLTLSTRKVNGKRKVRMLLQVPVVQTETINGIASPRVVREIYIDATFTIPDTSSDQEKKDAIGMFQSAFDSSKVLVNDTIIKGETIW